MTPHGYYRMIQFLQYICPNVILVLEGGYNLTAISRSTLACTQALLKLPLDIPDEDAISLPYTEIN